MKVSGRKTSQVIELYTQLIYFSTNLTSLWASRKVLLLAKHEILLVLG